MAASWIEVWNRRTLNRNIGVLEGLIALNGFDTETGKIKKTEWLQYASQLGKFLDLKTNESVFEVGCGSGALLYALLKHYNGLVVGGLDFSLTAIEVASQFLTNGKFTCADASELDSRVKYDHVISNSVFQYLTMESARKVLSLMTQKSRRSVLVADVPDAALKEESEAARKEALPPGVYDQKYSQVTHTYFERSFFEEFFYKNGMGCQIIDNFIPNYVNNPYRFNVIARHLSKDC